MSAAAEPIPEETYVYVIGPHEGPQKVGYSISPAVRCRSLGGKTFAVHSALAVPRSIVRAVERYAHCLLYEHHAKGEWFNVSPSEAADAIAKAAVAVANGETPPFYPILFARTARKPFEHRFQLILPPDLAARIDALRRTEEDLPSRAEMIRRLVVEAIEARAKRAKR